MQGTSTLCVAGIRANSVYNLSKHAEETYAFHNPCLSGEDDPLSLYVSYVKPEGWRKNYLLFNKI